MLVITATAVTLPHSSASAATLRPAVPIGSTPEYMLNVPPTHRMTPWQTMWMLAGRRLQEIRCLIPQASLQGTLREPKAEVCYRRLGMRICASSKLSFGPNNYSAGFFITNRPGECPF